MEHEDSEMIDPSVLQSIKITKITQSPAGSSDVITGSPQ